VAQNSAALQKKLTERQKLLSQLDQAKMQEQMNKAMTQLSATVGEDVPTFEQVRDKIERRLAKAQGMADLTSTNVDTKMLEVEQAQASAEAQARLSEIRSELGLTSPETEKPAPAPAPQPAEAEKPAEKPSP
jgi:phage shock protein A